LRPTFGAVERMHARRAGRRQDFGGARAGSSRHTRVGTGVVTFGQETTRRSRDACVAPSAKARRFSVYLKTREPRIELAVRRQGWRAAHRVLGKVALVAGGDRPRAASTSAPASVPARLALLLRVRSAVFGGQRLTPPPASQAQRRARASIIPYDFDSRSRLLGLVPGWPGRVAGTDRP